MGEGGQFGVSSICRRSASHRVHLAQGGGPLACILRTETLTTLAKVGAVLEPPPDQGAASTYEKSGTAPGVLQFLASIISDATKEEATLVKTEQHAQDVYAAYVKDSNQLMTTLISNIEAHNQSILDTQATIAEFKESLETVDVQHDDLNKVKADTHSECDFTLKYFKVRQRLVPRSGPRWKTPKLFFAGLT